MAERSLLRDRCAIREVVGRFAILVGAVRIAGCKGRPPRSPAVLRSRAHLVAKGSIYAFLAEHRTRPTDQPPPWYLGDREGTADRGRGLEQWRSLPSPGPSRVGTYPGGSVGPSPALPSSGLEEKWRSRSRLELGWTFRASRQGPFRMRQAWPLPTRPMAGRRRSVPPPIPPTVPLTFPLRFPRIFPRGPSPPTIGRISGTSDISGV